MDSSSSTAARRAAPVAQESIRDTGLQEGTESVHARTFRDPEGVLGGPASGGPARTKRDEQMSDDQVAPETRGAAVQLLATVDLGPEIEGMQGRQLRMRMVTMNPGGVFGPVHDHRGRPGIVYVLEGTITDHRDGISTEYGPGVGWPEDRTTLHWLENRGAVTAVEISVDVVTP